VKRVALLLALAGLALAAVLFARENFASIVALVLAAGPGLVLAALFHAFPMIANARAWQRLLPASQRPPLRVVALATWVRESVNGLLPVARIGGEVVAYRIVRRNVADGSEAAASLAADMAISLLSQAAFALAGIALLVAGGRTAASAAQIVIAALSLVPLGAGFVFVQRAGALSALTRIVDRLFAGKLGFLHSASVRFDEALRAIYDRRGDVGACFAWQLAGWVLGAGEIWLALRFLAEPRSFLDAVAIEALIQAVSSAAFIVPGAIGVQEGAFVVIGALLGLDGATALALATARRLRDVIVFIPGLAAWHWTELRRAAPAER
jgi:putative membrane protein